jgi:hypothetical protein
MLRITVHDSPRTLTFQLEGRLAGPWLRELEECWKNVLASQPQPILRVDLSGVTFINAAGQVCLAAMHFQGAEFVAPDCLTKAVVDEITQAPLADSRSPHDQDPSGPNSLTTEPPHMSDNLNVAWDQDTRLENFAAELTIAVYPLVLQRGPEASWLKVEMGLWRALGETVTRWARQRPAAALSDEFETWREGLRMALTDSALSVAVRHGIKGAVLEVALDLYQAFCAVI